VVVGEGHPKLRIPTQDAGMISAFPVTIIPQEEGYTRKLYNMDFDEIPGLLRKRFGLETFLGALAGTVKGAGLFLYDGATPYYMAAYTNKVVYTTVGSWTEIQPSGWTSSTGNVCDFVTQGGRVIATDGVNTPFMWDGSDVITLTEMPKARYTCQHMTRIYAAGMDDDPLALRVCHPGDPTVWDPFAVGSRAFHVYSGDDKKLTALLSMDDFVLIGKQSAMYALVGRTTTDFAIYPISPQIGVGSHWATRSIGGIAFFPDQFGRVYRLEPGGRPERVSSPVKDITDQVDPDHIEKARAFIYDNNQYVISLPTSEEGRVVLSYDTLRGRWRQWSNDVGTSMETPFFPGAIFSKRGGDQFFKFDPSSLADNGDEIESYVETMELHFGIPESEKEINNLWLGVWVAEEDFTIFVDCSVDGGNWETLNPIGTLISGNTGDYMRVRVPVGKLGRNVQFRVRNALADQDLRLLDMVVTFLPRELE